MSRIFISYKRVDKEKVFKIKDQIESALGEKCWIDLDGIESDAQFANVIINAINTCEVFLFMYSSAHALISDYKNDWTVRELDFAQHKKKRIVFVNIDASSLTDWFYMLFGTMQQVDATNHEQLSKLIQEIKGWLGNTELSHKDVARPIRPESNNSGISFSINALRKNKGCSIALTVAFVLCVVVIPLGYLNYTRVSDTEIIVGNTPTSSIFEDGEVTATPPIDEIEFVDLGLPSKTLWADRNIGAKRPIETGSYFEPFQQQEQDVPCEKCHGTGMVENLVCNYCEGTGIHTSLTVPSQEDYEELISCCKWTWIEKDGVNGYEVIGPSEKSIFLPEAVIKCNENERRNEIYKERHWSGYWTDSYRHSLEFAPNHVSRVDKAIPTTERVIRCIQNRR